MENPTYLGDGVYLKFDGHGYLLMANDHLFPTDQVYLEWSVVKNLITVINNFQEEIGGELIGK